MHFLKRFHIKWTMQSETEQTVVLNLDESFDPFGANAPFDGDVRSYPLPFEYKLFPGGEPHLKLGLEPLLQLSKKPPVILTQRVNSVEDFFKVLHAKDALDRAEVAREVHLFLPYFPAARQDRVCDVGEGLTVKIFADMINSANFASVTICSPHSEVTPALIDRCRVIDLDLALCVEVVDDFLASTEKLCNSEVNVVCPDAGAGKRVFKIVQRLQEVYGDNRKINLIRCDKVRCAKTGALKEFHVASDGLGRHPTIIFDDIVAMGGTFIGLAAALDTLGVGPLAIFTCHADCSAGLAKLASNFDAVYTTNSKHNFEDVIAGRVKVMPVSSAL